MTPWRLWLLFSLRWLELQSSFHHDLGRRYGHRAHAAKNKLALLDEEETA